MQKNVKQILKRQPCTGLHSFELRNSGICSKYNLKFQSHTLKKNHYKQ